MNLIILLLALAVAIRSSSWKRFADVNTMDLPCLIIFALDVTLWSGIHEFKNLFVEEYRSRPLNYLPLNSDFSNQVKIRIIVLKKI